MGKQTDKKILGVLRESRLFRQFADQELVQLISFSSLRTFKQGEVIIEEGKPNDRVYIIVTGRVGVFADDEFILTLGRKGDLFGEMSVITKKLTTAAVIAGSRVELFTISADEINDSGGVELRSMIYKIFLDILTEKLTATTKQVKGFQATKNELAISEDIISSVLESMSDGVVVADSDGQILHVNEAFMKMVGNIEIPLDFQYWPKTLGFYQKDIKTLIDFKDLPMLKAMVGQVCDSEEIYVKNPAMQEGRWLQASARPLVVSEEDSLDGAVVVYRDYTKKKNEELALIKAKEHAEATAKAKSEFLAVMSHELRTPLNGIIGMTDLLTKTQLDEEQQDCAESIRASGETLLNIVMSILDFSDLEAGTLRLTVAPFALKNGIEAVIQKLDSAAKNKNISLEVKLSSDLPAWAKGDQDRIQQILNNIVHNAIKFSSKGVVRISAKLSQTHQDEDELLFSVADEGIGIPQDKLPQLFEPFAQLDSTFARKFDGAGIGLSICKKLVEKMNGKIWVTSELGQGSTFHFTIRTEKVTQEAAAIKLGESKESKPKKLDQSFAEAFPCRILVAEDNAMNQKLIGKVLKKLGYAPVFAGNGVLAVEAVRKDPYDLILMDLQMPEMDGQEASRKIQTEQPAECRPKIIALTANVMDGIREQCLESGMVDYMAKPLRMDKLAIMLQKWL